MPKLCPPISERARASRCLVCCVKLLVCSFETHRQCYDHTHHQSYDHIYHTPTPMLYSKIPSKLHLCPPLISSYHRRCFFRTHRQCSPHTHRQCFAHHCSPHIQRQSSTHTYRRTPWLAHIHTPRFGQNHVIYTIYIQCFWQGNHRVYSHIRCTYTAMASPTHTTNTHTHTHTDALI